MLRHPRLWRHNRSVYSSLPPDLNIQDALARLNNCLAAAGPRRHLDAQAEGLHGGAQQATSVTHVPANGITTTNVSPLGTTDLAKFAIAAPAQLYPLSQAAIYRLHLTSEGYQSGDLLTATFIDQCQGLTRPLVSSSSEGREDEEVRDSDGWEGRPGLESASVMFPSAVCAVSSFFVGSIG